MSCGPQRLYNEHVTSLLVNFATACSLYVVMLNRKQRGSCSVQSHITTMFARQTFTTDFYRVSCAVRVIWIIIWWWRLWMSS